MKLNILSVIQPQLSDILTRVSVGETGWQGNGFSRVSGVSADGRGVVFETDINFDPNDTNTNSSDVYYKDLVTGKLAWITSPQVQGIFGFGGYNSQISPNGRFVMFESAASNLVLDDRNQAKDIFIKDLATGTVSRATNAIGLDDDPDSSSDSARFSQNGNSIVFASLARNLDPNDNNFLSDIYTKHLLTGEMRLVSLSGTAEPANGHSWAPQFASDGQSIIFESEATNLVPKDQNGRIDIFIKNLRGDIELLTKFGDIQANADCRNAVASPDGRYVLFETRATTFVGNDDNNLTDVFLKDLTNGAITRISSTSSGAAGNGHSSSVGAQFSPDGRYVIFKSDASNLVADDRNEATDIFRRDLLTGETIRISTAADGTEILGTSIDGMYSLDGRYFVYSSTAPELVANDTNGAFDVFRVDLLYQANAAAIAQKRFVEVKLDVGLASSATIAWGDGTSSSLPTPGGIAALNHTYASTGQKATIVTLNEGALAWRIAHNLDLTTGSMVRNTAVADTLSGGDGGDTLTGDGFANYLLGGGGNDRLSSAGGNDRLEAGSGNDVLSASTGNDQLIGGTGKDTLTGGSGRDVFVFDDRETSSSKSSADTILDFAGRSGDKIDLRAVDANTKKSGDQKFSVIGNSAFSKAGELRFEKTKSYTYVYLNTDNDRAAEGVIKLKGSFDLSKGWFVL